MNKSYYGDLFVSPQKGVRLRQKFGISHRIFLQWEVKYGITDEII